MIRDYHRLYFINQKSKSEENVGFSKINTANCFQKERLPCIKFAAVTFLLAPGEDQKSKDDIGNASRSMS